MSKTNRKQDPYALSYTLKATAPGGTRQSVDSTPKRVTKGVKRQLRKVLRQNETEFDRQAALHGVSRVEIERKVKH